MPGAPHRVNKDGIPFQKNTDYGVMASMWQLTDRNRRKPYRRGAENDIFGWAA